jgi:hypothetical protein
MNPTEPPNDLERMLAARTPLEPDPRFRQRVLTAMRAELHLPVAPTSPRSLWQLAALTAAALLLAVNFSMSVAGDADFRLAARTSPDQVTATANRLRGLYPELSEDEARRTALVLRAGSESVTVPEPRSFSTRHTPEKEPRQWPSR